MADLFRMLDNVRSQKLGQPPVVEAIQHQCTYVIISNLSISESHVCTSQRTTYISMYVYTYMDCPVVAQCRAILLVTVVVRWCDCVTVYCWYSMCAVIERLAGYDISLLCTVVRARCVC